MGLVALLAGLAALAVGLVALLASLVVLLGGMVILAAGWLSCPLAMAHKKIANLRATSWDEAWNHYLAQNMVPPPFPL